MHYFSALSSRHSMSLLCVCLVFGYVCAEAQQRPFYTEYGKPQDVSIPGAKRIGATILIQPGYTEAQIRALLEQAAWTIGTRENAKATTVYAYRTPDEVSGHYTVGRAIYAPNGQWADARSNAPMAVTVEVGTLYFRPDDTETQPKPGAQVKLVARDAALVGLSRSAERWGREDIIVRIPTGTSATLLERKAFPITADYILSRCRVRVQWESKMIEGWVNGDEVEQRVGAKGK